MIKIGIIPNKSKSLSQLAAFLLTFSFILIPFSPVLAKNTKPVSVDNNSSATATKTKITGTQNNPPTGPIKANVAGVTEPYNTSGAQQTLQPKTDLNTGALTFEYPIKVPEGRNGQAPDLKLQYNSKNNFNDSIFGYGWTISIPYILSQEPFLRKHLLRIVFVSYNFC